MASFRPDDFRSTISVIAIFKLIRDKYTLQVVEKAFKVIQMLFSISLGNRLIDMVLLRLQIVNNNPIMASTIRTGINMLFFNF